MFSTSQPRDPEWKQNVSRMCGSLYLAARRQIISNGWLDPSFRFGSRTRKESPDSAPSMVRRDDEAQAEQSLNPRQASAMAWAS